MVKGLNLVKALLTKYKTNSFPYKHMERRPADYSGFLYLADGWNNY